ncbi:uncharacterized protein LTR77_005895 [Saxophila tyrrhenica]|uniref:Uncharacterized protein n=1 Tax=Saxophila tyrrhenica TaxID=1690608 RepID=A0AAV9PAE5_9PEZI|nr:hypothetical protein LTR77_005895 [Saxophila tyrrhenica]
MAESEQTLRLYAFEPSYIAPIVFAVVIGISLIVHIFQNFYYRFWRTTFWMFWGGTVFTAGWIMRIFSSYDPSNKALYIAQTCLVLGGPPIYAAAEYNILGRLMSYLPMHAVFHPRRVIIVFVYLGALVESLTAAGAAKMAASKGLDISEYVLGGKLVSISLVLQAAVECVFVSFVATMHYRAARAHHLSRNVRALCFMLYGTSALVLFRCIFRAVEAFATQGVLTPEQCGSLCRLVETREWYIYVFEATPMAIYTIWLNVMHPGRYLPRNKFQYLDVDGTTERLGPGWVDRRSQWQTWADPFDLVKTIKGRPAHEKYWLQSERWPAAEGSFAQGTASNATRSLSGKLYRRVSMKPEV